MDIPKHYTSKYPRRLALAVRLCSFLMTGVGWAGISPTAVELNLSAFPIDMYNTPNSGGLIRGCSSSITVRQCVQQLFQTGANNWRAQGISGVRFFFTLANGHYSDPFDAYGNVKSSWSQNLLDFFNDLRSYGITKVTPTPVLDTWSGPPSMMQTLNVITCGVSKNLNFVPWLPYGLDPLDSNFPDRTCGNNSYFNAAANPLFGGWSRFFNLINTVLSRASQAQLSVIDMDYFQETNMADFTVMARFIYDNKANVDVLSELRSRMSWNYFQSTDVAPSANIPPTPTPAWGNCGSYYGDSALLLTLTAQTAAIAGPWSAIGVPPHHIDFGQLRCYSSGDSYPEPLISLPVWHSQPTVTDIHSQKYYASDSDTSAYANSFYSSMWSFLQYRGLTGNDVVFGETNPVACEGYTAQSAAAMLNGYKASTLYSNAASRVVMRPWHRTESGFACVDSPHTLNPPYDPFNP